jgi:hypothetical protein
MTPTKVKTMHGTPPIFGDHLARSVRGRPGAPPMRAMTAFVFSFFQEYDYG